MSTQTITWPQLDQIESNDDRAEMVRPLVDAYRAEHYYGPEEDGTIITDMIANLMHLADRTESGFFESIDGPFLGGLKAIERASGHYEAEIEEERLEAVMEDEERSRE